jgi:hypothetical protein
MPADRPIADPIADWYNCFSKVLMPGSVNS